MVLLPHDILEFNNYLFENTQSHLSHGFRMLWDRHQISEKRELQEKNKVPR